MNKEQLHDVFKPKFDSFNHWFSKNLDSMYPLDACTQTTFNEANLTSNFLKTLWMEDKDGQIAAWDEFPVPKGTRLDDPSSRGKVDSIIVDHVEKQIFLLESKRLRQLNKKYPDETVADTQDDPASLMSDLAREFVIANSDILPNRIWKPGEPFNPLKEEYEDYRVFGLGLCGIWAKDGVRTESDVESAFIRGGTSLLKQHPALNVIDLSEGIVFVSEIKGKFPEKVSSQWQFFTLLYVWEIQRLPQHFRSLNNALCVDDLIQELQDSFGIVSEQREAYWYLYPSEFVGTFVRGRENKNKLWIYKHNNQIELFAYSEKDGRAICLPQDFLPKGKYISKTINSDDAVSALGSVFAKIVDLNKRS